MGVFRIFALVYQALNQYSPRWWGCSAKGKDGRSNWVGIPHAGGGVPSNRKAIISKLKVFPTLVGVFRLAWNQAAQLVSYSPRWWGCSESPQIKR